MDTPTWADLVFHVLAHVRASAHLAPSVYDSTYVRFAERHLGSASTRTLSEDAGVLGRVASTHDLLAGVQLLAWLFKSVERACATADRELSELKSCDVDEPKVLASLAWSRMTAEILRCAAILEKEHWQQLPTLQIDPATFLGAIREAVQWAPALRKCQFGLVRALRLRGRVRGTTVWVGAACDDPGPSLEHVVWQASHEATVLEVSEAARLRAIQPSHRGLESAAIVLLAERASERGVAREHAQWLRHLGANAPSVRRDSLDGVWRDVVVACRDAESQGALDRSGT